MKAIGAAVTRYLEKADLQLGPAAPDPVLPTKITRRTKVIQPILGLVAPAGPTITPSQREMVRRAGTFLSVQQRATARRRARNLAGNGQP